MNRSRASSERKSILRLEQYSDFLLISTHRQISVALGDEVTLAMINARDLGPCRIKAEQSLAELKETLLTRAVLA